MSRGFSVIELLVVVSIVAIGTALAAPHFATSMRDKKLSAASRALISDIKRTRAVAVSARALSNGQRAQAAGLRFDTSTRYAVFIDPDDNAQNMNEIDLETVDLLDIASDGAVRIISPGPGTQLRFRRDGSTTTSYLLIGDPERRKRWQIEVTAAGQVRLEPVAWQ